MSDDAYIKPARRRPESWRPGTWSSDLAFSHAVADSVMNDLAEALRVLGAHDEACLEWQDHEVGAGSREACAQCRALARFDALNKDNT